jgi:hypothetical protein
VRILAGIVAILSQETAKLILPFLALSSDRTELFSDEAEKAAVFCLAEIERGKGGGFVARQPPERISFIAKAAYPFLLFPFEEIGLVFDGLNSASHTTSFPSVPDTQAFTEGIERSASSRETYTSFLSDNINYFRASSKQENLLTAGLVADAAFLDDFASYLAETGPLDASSPDIVVLKSAVDESTILSEVNELEKLKARFIEESRSLNKGMKLLNLTSKGFVKAIRGEIKKVKDELNAELEKHRGPVEEEVKKIRRKGDEEIAAVSRKFEKELLTLQKEKVKHEKARDQLSEKIALNDVEIRTSAAHKDKAAERRWKNEKGKRKKERSDVESQIKRLGKELKEAEDGKAQELFRIKLESDTKIQEARKELVEIESSRDAKVQILKQEEEKIEELTSGIVRQIDGMARQRESTIASLGKLGLPQKDRKPSMVYVSFYLVCLQSESRKRYVHYPPSKVNSVKLLVKLKGALGMTRIKQLFSPRSVPMASFLNRFPSMLEDNVMFEREVAESATGADMLKAQGGKELIRSGLKQLREEGWLSEKEYSSFSNAVP